MLRELRIRDFAIIEDLHLEFSAGLNVLTGETGAGKSIIMQGLALLCGGRASPEAVRAGADEAAIEGIFDLSAEEAAGLAELGIDAADDLHVRRVVSRSSKGRVHLNGSPTSIGLLAQLGARLIHLYGQHEQALLLRPESHLELLDAYAAHAGLVTAMAERYDRLYERQTRLERLRGNRDAARQRAELLRFQHQELDAAGFQPGEDDSLRREKDVLAHAEKLLQICQEGDQAIEAGDESLTSNLARTVQQLREATRVDPSLGEVVELLDSAAAQLEEAAGRLRRYGERISFDPERREAVEERWALMQRLVRKYGGSLATLLQAHEETGRELADLEGDGSNLEGLEKEVAEAEAEAREAAAALSASRRRKARDLEKNVGKELQSLGMKGAVFAVRFAAAQPERPTLPLSRTGTDELELHFSANPGEPPRPLARVASGGELSRIMLALKVLTAGQGDVATLVFDEVDAGIGGGVADAVGAHLRQLGGSRQILCITHLPQIAARADHHYVVEKEVRQGRTASAARHLGREERIAELSRMLGGDGDAEALRWARRLVSTREGAEGSGTRR